MSRIRIIRERLGLTQNALAEGIGCTQGNVGHYERGQTVPPKAAMRLVELAAGHGLMLTLDQVYGLQPLPPVPVRTAADLQLVDRRTVVEPIDFPDRRAGSDQARVA